MVKIHKVKVQVTHQISNEALRAFWAYHRSEPFTVGAALALYRQVQRENPEVETQINEGQAILGQGRPVRDFKRAPDGHVLEGDED